MTDLKKYSVARDGREIGEFEPYDFFERVRSGAIRQTDLFWMEGMPGWKPVSTVSANGAALNPAYESDPSQPIQEKKPQSLLVFWLRWVGVLPAALAAYLVVQLVNALLNWFLPDLLMQAWNSYVGPVAFVYAGSYVAPSHRFHVAIALSIVLSAVGISVVALYALTVRQFGWHFTWLLICTIISVGAAVSACMSFLKEQHEQNYQPRF